MHIFLYKMSIWFAISGKGQGMSKVVSTTFISCDLTEPLARTEFNFKRGKDFFFSLIKQSMRGSIFRGGGDTDRPLAKS